VIPGKKVSVGDGKNPVPKNKEYSEEKKNRQRNRGWYLNKEKKGRRSFQPEKRKNPAE